MHADPATHERPDPNLIVLWRLRALGLALGSGVFACLIAWPLWVQLAGLGGAASLRRALAVGLGAGIATALILMWHNRVAAAVYRWQHRPGEGVVVWKGAWWQREVWIPLARLQHLDIKRGPLEHWLGLATLELYTAGSHDYETRLPGLAPQRAQALRDALLAELQPQRGSAP